MSLARKNFSIAYLQSLTEWVAVVELNESCDILFRFDMEAAQRKGLTCDMVVGKMKELLPDELGKAGIKGIEQKDVKRWSNDGCMLRLKKEEYQKAKDFIAPLNDKPIIVNNKTSR